MLRDFYLPEEGNKFHQNLSENEVITPKGFPRDGEVNRRCEICTLSSMVRKRT